MDSVLHSVAGVVVAVVVFGCSAGSALRVVAGLMVVAIVGVVGAFLRSCVPLLPLVGCRASFWSSRLG